MEPTLGQGFLGVIRGGDMLVAQDTIVAVGKGLRRPQAVLLDATGKIVLPGFVDAHDHLWQSVIRGCGTDKDLLGWLKECVFPLYGAEITEEEAYAAVKLSTLGLIATGVTTVLDSCHSFNSAFANGNIKALRDSGLRFVLAYCFRKGHLADLKQAKKELIATHPRAFFQICSHPSMTRLASLTAAARLAHQLRVPLNLHLCENIKQRQDEPIKAMRLAGAFDEQLVLNHAVHLTDDEIVLLAQRDARIVHNPLSNMRLASGIIRLAELHDSGVRIGLGLDGGTNDTTDMFANMKAAVGLQRLQSLRADVFPSCEEVLRLATLGGAEVLGMDERIGTLSPGKKADFIILDPSGINFAPRWDWVSQIVFNGQPVNVEYVFVDGRPLKAGGRILDVSLSTAVQAAERAAARIRRVIREPEGNVSTGTQR
jgi:5-methylthioadenosine/S-adenosylhomocysteine deaminase